MLHVTEALHNELLKLQSQLSEPQDVEVNALMSLLDDWDCNVMLQNLLKHQSYVKKTGHNDCDACGL